MGDHHPLDTEIRQAARKFAAWSTAHVDGLRPFIDKFKADEDDEPKRLRSVMFQGPRPGGLGLMRDIQDLGLLAQECEIGWLALKQVAKALGEKDLEKVAETFGEESHGVVAWCHTAFKAHISQALIMG